MSLGATFAKAQLLYEELEKSSLRPDSEEYQAKVQECKKGLVQAAVMVRREGIFSANEELDDINTECLRYLLIPFYMGMVELKVSEFEPAKRIPILEKSRSLLEAFVSDGERNGTITKEDRSNYDDLDNKDAATRRELLIARTKREKAARERMRLAMERQVDREKRHKQERSGDDPEEADIDEEAREYMLSLLQASALQAFDSLKSTRQELIMLQRVAAMPQRPQADPAMKQYQAEQTQELRKIAQALGGGGAGSSDATTASRRDHIRQVAPFAPDRQRLQEGVFQYGHNLPTMTVEEFAEIEFAEAKERQRKEQAAEAAKELVDSDNEEEVDKATYKAREWDKFTDDNQKGAGNTKR